MRELNMVDLAVSLNGVYQHSIRDIVLQHLNLALALA
jgi:hypothetical protein